MIARFTATDWECRADGWCTIKYRVRVDHDMYFRLRGTNLAVDTADEIDANGDPLPDSLGPNAAELAWTDLWFYSNPIQVRVKR